MKATPELRWKVSHEYIGCGDWEDITVLQQLWFPEPTDPVATHPEWRDVPTVKVK